MWKAEFRNSAGGLLDDVEGDSEEQLKLRLIEKISDTLGWTLSKGDTITIVEGDD